ncbi:MAG: exo-alpha-sialidase [Clostridia bacterium]|nr:exo-alpha-sialidase [Clostridia bacterium]
MNDVVIRRNTVWDATKTEYVRHRIPGMIVTDKGTLIVYNEARLKGDDWARMDIFAQRSEDGGENFGERIYLARMSNEIDTVNNPVMVQDARGRIHFLYCENYSINGGRVLHRVSEDDGVTWGEATDITEATLPQYRNAFALGPGHGIRSTDGTLLIPVWMVPKCFEHDVTSHNPSVISVLYSKDDGDSWQLGEIFKLTEDAVNPSETELALTSDGRVYLNARVDRCGYRVVAYSDNGYCRWSQLTPDRTLTDPTCFGSCVSCEVEGRRAIAFANCDSLTERKNVTLRFSFDDGCTWACSEVIDAERGGYVESAYDSRRGVIYVLYEENGGDKCHLAIVKVGIDQA